MPRMLIWLSLVAMSLQMAFGQERGADGFIRMNGGCGTKPGGKVCSIVSLNYPEEAPANLKQTWSFLSAEDYQYTALKMTCHDISFPKDSSCSESFFKLHQGREDTEWCKDTSEFTLLTKKDYVRFSFNTGPQGGGRVNCSIWAVRVTKEGAEITTVVKPTTPKTTPSPSGTVSRAPLPQFLITKSEERDSSEQGTGGGEKSTSCPCGWSNKAVSRIVKGSFTEENEFPWMAAIMEKKTKWNFCGGSIITAYHVLTAAHCTDDAVKDKTPLVVAVGAHDIKKTIPGITELIDVEKITPHENYVTKVWKNDISLLTLAKEITFSPHVGRVCLPTQQMDLGRSYVKIMGWGSIYAGGPSSSILKKVDVRVVPPSECTVMYKTVDEINRTQICTFAKSRASCQGDSGGPVVWVDPETNRYTLIGLVSFGRVCADISPSVHTDVAYYMPWIEKQIAASKAAATCKKI